MKQRNRTIDLAKGIAIILMVIGHCYCAENDILRMIYAFHMPFFFLLSGMLYAEKWKEEIRFSLRHTGRKLLIPYILFDVLFGAFILVLGRTDHIIRELITSIAWRTISLTGVSVTWYLPCQLMVLCIFALLVKYVKEPLRIPLAVLLYVTALFVKPIILPLWRGLIGVGFFVVGYYGKTVFQKPCKPLWLLGLGAAFFFLARRNGMVSLVSLEFANPALYTINALLGSYLLYQISIKLSDCKWSAKVEYFGRNSAIILCTHMFLWRSFGCSTTNCLRMH